MTEPTSEPIATAATSFQAGLLCPACQANVAQGEAIITCSKCATTHHASCWASAGRCSSYHCDPSTKAAPANGGAEIVITATEASNAILPPKRIPMSSAEVAERARVPVPTAWSVAGLVLAALSFGALGVSAIECALVTKMTPPVAFLSLGGFLFCFVVGLASAIVAGNLRKSRTHRGGGLALLALLAAVPGAGLFIASCVKLQVSHMASVPFDLAAPEPPAPETFEHAPAPIANAMRANVFVQGHELTGRSWCGAGVVLGRRSGRVFILTNRHVTDPSQSGSPGDLSVTFASGEIAGGHVEWTAPPHVDLAVVSCAATRPPRVLTRLRRTPLNVGEKNFAIGNPHSLAWTYTEGVVSRVHEKHPADGGSLEVIQTQTPIHPGNSGGGLYDASGRLVGINTWVESDGGAGFAISVKTAIGVMPQEYIALTAEDTGDEKGDGD